jgi:hypothetical protein
MYWATPAALGFAEIEGEQLTFHHGNFSKKCHTMVIADHVLYRRLWPVGARFGATPSLYMSQETWDVLGLLKLAGKQLKYSTFMSIILQIRKFILNNKPVRPGQTRGHCSRQQVGLDNRLCHEERWHEERLMCPPTGGCGAMRCRGGSK